MKLYFYCSSGSLLEYFTINKIVCNEYLSNKSRKVIHSLGLVSDKFLFLSPLKLSLEKRTAGFDKDYMELGTVIDLNISDEDAKSFPVLALDKEGKLSDDFVCLSNVPEGFLGVFVKGEISFTYINHIIFDNDNAKDDIYRPSKDLYFPEHLYSVIDDSFVDDIDVNVISDAGKSIDEKYKDLDIISEINKRNKITSIFLNTIIETKAWPFGAKHKANFDDITANIVGISEKLNELTDGKYSELKNEEYIDEILVKIDDDNDYSSMAPFFKSLVLELISLSTKTFSQKEFECVKNNVINTISTKYSDEQKNDIIKKIDVIEELVYGSSSHGLEKVLTELPHPYDVLKAMIFFLRSPLSPMKLSEGLNVYKAESHVCRYAWIMFAALNGLEPISAEKTGNEYLMRIAESKAMKLVPVDNGLNNISSVYELKTGFVPVIEEEVSSELVRETILSESYVSRIPELIKMFASNPVFKKGFKESNYKLISNPFINWHITNEYISLSEADDYISKLKNSLKKAQFQYNTAKFLDEYIRDEKVFMGLYKKDETFWKNVYKNRNK